MNQSNFRIISFELNGIKSISKAIKLQFLNQLVKVSNFDESNVKVLYGPNGAGKTAIVSALSFYKRIICDYNALDNPRFNRKFYTLANKHAKSIFFSVIFAGRAENNGLIKVKHTLEFAVDEDKKWIYISREVITKLGSRNNESSLFEVQSSKLVSTPFFAFQDLLINRLDNNSIVPKFISLFPQIGEKKDEFSEGANYLVLIFLFAQSLFIYFGSDENVLCRPYLVPRSLVPSANPQELANGMRDMNKPTDRRYLVSVRHKDIESYYQHIGCVTKFVKLFKPELKLIEIDKRDLDNEYLINLTFVYEDGSRVDFENESTGIKKIVTLSNALEVLSDGGIAIIDEIDSGIMDRIVSEVVDYACKFTNGQLLLTTHHVGLMDVVKNIKHSIDFISTDSILTKWVNNGNYNPERVFQNGGIPHIPLNIHSFDFIDVFSEENDGGEE